MPFTPFHLGPALFFGLLLFRKINFPTFIITNVIVDIEPFLVLYFGLNYPLHGFFHSFLGGSIVAVILSFIMAHFDKSAQKIAESFKLGQKLPAKSIWLAAFSGIYLHIVLDSFLYTDIKPFYPFSYNPFYALLSPYDVYSLCIFLFFGGLLVYGYKSVKNTRT